jgi:hypothetical protein
MTAERIEEIQSGTAYPQSISVQQALLQVWNECEQEQNKTMYSEEDLRKAYFSGISSTGEGWNGEYADGNDPNIEEKFSKGFKEWFEQFKKK